MAMSASVEFNQSDEAVRIFGRIAPRYDLLKHILSFGLDVWWRRHLVQQLKSGPTGRVLDLAAGTLSVALAIQRRYPGLRVYALDLSLPMLEYGAKKCRKKNISSIYPTVGDGRSLPLADASVDCVIIAFGICHITPRSKALDEILRVLTPSGRICVLEFGNSSSRIWHTLHAFYLKRVLPVISRLAFGKAASQYFTSTLTTSLEAETLATEISAAGFARVFHLPLTSGIVQLHIADKAP
jgi:demethylmenaquinone methyltransferase/2-methoxy-6-polyprenyl-1,4-benzoquinol methylase